jgi:hypothetical protein
MPVIKRLSASVTLIVLSLGLAASVPVYAQHGADDTSTSSVASTTETESGTTTAGTETTETESHTGSSKVSLAADHEHGNRQQKTTEQKQKLCVAHKKGLETKFSHIVTNSQRMKTRIDGIFTKAQDYQTKNNLTVANYDTLVAAATTAQTAAADSITNLQAVTPSLDCNSTSVASDVAAFKTAAKDTVTKLKAYRMAVKDLLHALATAKHAAADTTKTTEGSNQ